MYARNTEKLERRQVAASDLVVAAGELPDGIEVDLIATETASSGNFCTPTQVAATSTSLQSSMVFEQTSMTTLALDVNRDGIISPTDVDLVMATIGGESSTEPMLHPEKEGDGLPVQDYEVNSDVNADGFVTPADVLAVINRVNFYNSLVPCNCASCLANAIV